MNEPRCSCLEPMLPQNHALDSLERDQPQTTLSGRSEQAWLNHIATLFTIASPGEDIPWQALLAWTGTPTEEDFMWARKRLAEVTARQAAVPESQDGFPLAQRQQAVLDCCTRGIVLMCGQEPDAIITLQCEFTALNAQLSAARAQIANLEQALQDTMRN